MTDPLRRALRHGPDCPSAESLIDVIEHGAPGDRSVIESHLQSCPACQAELALYRGFQAANVQPDEKKAVEAILTRLESGARAETPRPSFWSHVLQPARKPVWIGGAAFAMAAILVAVGLTSQFGSRRQSSSTGEETDNTLRSSAITVTSPVGDVPEAPRVIAWRPVPGAQQYSVTLAEVDGNPLFHKNVTTSEIRLPESTLTLLKPGKKILLNIEAGDASGATLAQSGAIGIKVLAPR